MSITTVHHASMYVHQGQPPLAATVTAGAPATFSGGHVPSTVKELRDSYADPEDFGLDPGDPLPDAWDPEHYVELSGKPGRFYTWDGEDWVTWTAPDPDPDPDPEG